MEKALYTLPEAAEMLRVSKSTLLRLIKGGELHPVKRGRRYTRIPREGLVAFIERHKA